MYVFMYVFMYCRLNKKNYIYIYFMYVCVCMCMCIYIYIYIFFFFFIQATVFNICIISFSFLALYFSLSIRSRAVYLWLIYSHKTVFKDFHSWCFDVKGSFLEGDFMAQWLYIKEPSGRVSVSVCLVLILSNLMNNPYS